MFLTEHRERRELAFMDNADFVRCPKCGHGFDVVVSEGDESSCKCPACKYEFVVTVEKTVAA